MSHVILEGPDGGGKSTLAQQLVTGRGYDYAHHGLYPTDTGRELLERYTRSLLVKPATVIDRCFLSEFTYGRVMRGADRLGSLGFIVLTRLTRALGTCEIICLPPWETALSNWLVKRRDKFDPINRKGDYVDATAKLSKIYDLYCDVAAALPHYQKWDYLRGVGPLLKFTDPLPVGMTGSPDAQFLVVGQQINLSQNPEWELPFHSLTGSSRYITEALHTAGFEESRLAFTNAVDRNGKQRFLYKFVQKLPHFKMGIALGEEAAKVCDDEGIPHVKVPHPAYWKRFKSKNFNDYVNQLRSIHESPVRQLLRCVVPVA